MSKTPTELNKTLAVTETDPKNRLDKYLAAKLEGLTQPNQKLIETKHVLVNGKLRPYTNF